MIKYIQGDLFTTPHRYIAHGVNTQGVMGSGVAKIVREKYPEVYGDYRQFCTLRHANDLLGHVRKSPTSDGKMILNCFTQSAYGITGQRFMSYDAMDDCMATVNKILKADGIDHISMPMIGAGLGGGQWSIVEQIIDHNLKNVIVYIYQL